MAHSVWVHTGSKLQTHMNNKLKIANNDISWNNLMYLKDNQILCERWSCCALFATGTKNNNRHIYTKTLKITQISK